MARKVITTMVDDYDGTESDDIQAVAFSAFGQNYTIDLNSKNSAKLEKALAPFVEKATKVSRLSSTGSARKSSGTGNSPEYLGKVREWAKANGHEVSERGRIKASVLEAYEAAN